VQTENTAASNLAFFIRLTDMVKSAVSQYTYYVMKQQIHFQFEKFGSGVRCIYDSKIVEDYISF
jgi:hypothetical protein